MQSSGYLAVGIFFFISGYGIFILAQEKNYLKNFWKSRFLPLYLFYIVLIGMYLKWKIILGISISEIDIVCSMLFGRTIAVAGWYLQCLFVVYILYYFIFKFTEKNKLRIVIMTLSMVMYCLICKMLKLPTTWYESIFCLIAGMLCAFYKDGLDDKIKVTPILFGGTYIAQFKLGIIFKMFSAVFFCVSIILLTYLLKETKVVQNKITNCLGKYSLEIYVAQGFFLIIRNGNRFNHINTVLFIAVVTIGTFVVALGLHQIYKLILNYSRLCRESGRKPHNYCILTAHCFSSIK